MRKSLKKIRYIGERHSATSALFREFILGGQDGLVNVLGVILGIAIATSQIKLVIIAGLAAAFAESFSMAAVAYTSAKASEDYYASQQEKEKYEMKTIPNIEKKEVYDLYYQKGFRGKLLNNIVKHIISNKKTWLNVMMHEELKLEKEVISPVKSAIVVGVAAIIGSLIPLFTFFFLPIKTAMIGSLIVSAASLFLLGAVEAKSTVGHWLRKGIQLAAIGMGAALIGFIVGKLVGVSA